MPNMSYCRFENTSADIKDCIEALEENDWNLEAITESASSEHEAMAMRRFVQLCKDVAENFLDCEE